VVVGAEVPDGITAKSTGRAASSTLIPVVGSGGAYEREGLIADRSCNLGRFDFYVAWGAPRTASLNSPCSPSQSYCLAIGLARQQRR
jgi:hypothetical protein